MAIHFVSLPKRKAPLFMAAVHFLLGFQDGLSEKREVAAKSLPLRRALTPLFTRSVSVYSRFPGVSYSNFR